MTYNQHVRLTLHVHLEWGGASIALSFYLVVFFFVRSWALCIPTRAGRRKLVMAYGVRTMYMSYCHISSEYKEYIGFDGTSYVPVV